MNSQKPTTNEEKSVTAGVVILALLASAIGLGVVKCGKTTDAVAGDLSSALPAGELAGGDLKATVDNSAELEGLNTTVQSQKSDLGKLERNFKKLESEHQIALANNADLNDKLSKALSATGDATKTGAGALTGALAGVAIAQPQAAGNDSDQEGNLGELQDKLTAAQAEINALKSKNAEMAKSANGGDDAKYERVRNANEELQRKNSDLEDKLKQAMAGAGTDAPAGNLEEELKKRDAEWEKKMAGMLRKSELDKAELVAKLEGKKRNLEADGKQAADAPVFVKSLRDLPMAAQGLFGELKKVEDMKNPDLDKVYEVVKTKTGGVSKGRVKFASGSTSVGPKGRQQVSTAMSSIGKESLILVVGFADRSGDSTANEKISSARAKAVAAKLQEKLPKGQRIKAVYLGETDRFGAKSENRVVEIWEIAR